MSLKKFLTAAALLGSLSACAAPQTPMNGGTVYRGSETMSSMRVAACRVEQARYVAIVGDSQADANRSSVNSVVGVATGALIGRAIGGEIGRGKGNDLARDLGTIAGGVVGSNVADNINANRVTRTGVEYSVDLGEAGRRVFVQHLGANEAPLTPGSACRVVGNGMATRVLPA